MAAKEATSTQLHELRTQLGIIASATDNQDFTDEATEFLNLLVQASGNQALAFVSTLLHRLIRVRGAGIGRRAQARSRPTGGRGVPIVVCRPVCQLARSHRIGRSR